MQDGDPFLEEHFVSQEGQARAQRCDLRLRLLPLGRQLQDGGLPDLVVLGTKFADVIEYGGVEKLEEDVCLCELAFFDLGEGVAKDAGLVFDVLEGEGGVGFEELEAFVNGFEEGFLGRGVRWAGVGWRGVRFGRWI